MSRHAKYMYVSTAGRSDGMLEYSFVSAADSSIVEITVFLPHEVYLGTIINDFLEYRFTEICELFAKLN